MGHFIDATKKVTNPNHMENLVAELLARNVELGIASHICALKVPLELDEIQEFLKLSRIVPTSYRLQIKTIIVSMMHHRIVII